METIETQEHVSWDCTYHVVIVPKYRKRALYGPVRKRIGEIIKELAKWKGITVVKGNACPDHIHMVISIPPKYSVAHTMGYLKGKSAIQMYREFGRKHLPLLQKSFWTRGYFVRTIGIDQEIVNKYVEDQWKKIKFTDGPELDLHWD